MPAKGRPFSFARRLLLLLLISLLCLFLLHQILARALLILLFLIILLRWASEWGTYKEECCHEGWHRRCQ